MRVGLSSWLAAMFCAVSVLAQDRTISGTVTDGGSGEALPGVNVIVKGTNQGTVTDIEGNYNLSVADGAETLSFSFIGYQTQEVPINGQSQIDIQLGSDTKQLSEVVVTALGIEREERSLGYAVQEIDGEALNKVNETNVVNSLQGRVAGVQINGNTGGLGGSSRILIRGANSVAGQNQPLFVVDGIPLDNSNFNTTDQQRGASGYDYGNAAQDIDPNNIESVSVLKGASAAALYGNRAANGVIIITTKKGSARQGVGVTVNSQVLFQDILVLPEYQNLYGGGAGPFRQNADGQDVVLFNVDESWGPRLDGRPVRQWYSYYPEIEEFNGQATPWVAHPDNIRDFFETGLQNTNSVALEGGNETGTFRLGYTNLNTKGIMPNSNLNRNTLNFNGSLNLTDKFTASAGINYVRTDAKGRPEQGYGNVIVQFNHFGQRQLDMGLLDQYWITPTGEQRTWNRRSAANPFPQYANNPYWIRRKNFQNDDRQRVYGNVNLSYEFTDWLTLTGRLLHDYYTDRREERIANGSIDQSSYSEDVREVRETNADLILTADKNLNEDLSITGLVGVNTRFNSLYRNYGETVGGLSVPDFFNLENSTNRPTIDDIKEERRINSVFGSATLGWRDLIYLEGTLRNDWSSTLPDGNNSFLYPSVGGSFVFSALEGISDSPILSYGKLRASWAQVGNDTDPYRTALTYQPRDNFGPDPVYRVPLQRNNVNLRPEETRSYEFGIETQFFQNRIGLDVTYYNSSSTDQIFEVPVTGAAGYTSQIVNAGEVTNQGVELLLRATPVETENFRWDIVVNWARNRNRLESLTEDQSVYQISAGLFGVTTVAIEGQPLGSLYGSDFEYAPDGSKLVDDNGLYIQSDSLRAIGTTLADWTGGITNTFTYKGLSLNVLVDARQGSDIYSITNLFGKYSGMMEETVAGNIREEWLIAEGVQNVAEENEAPRYERNNTAVDPQTFFSSMFGNGRASTYDGSFVKLREVSLSYTLPNGLFENRIKNVSLSLIGRNLAMIYKKIPHIDPESVASSTNAQGVEGGVLPSLRSYGFSVRFGL